VTKDEIKTLEAFLRKRLGNPKIEVRMRMQAKGGKQIADSAEVYIGQRDEDFLGVLYREEEDGELSYQFQMAILDIDLEDA
jgi:hypothetical protein